MMLKEHDINSIKKNIQYLINGGTTELTAINIAVSYARGRYKREHPETSLLPVHLTPGQILKTYRKECDNNAEEE